MDTLIIYDSVFGNTKKIAEIMGETLKEKGQTYVLHVNDVTPAKLTEVNLVIIGSPTRAFNPTKSIRQLLKSLPREGLKGVEVAVFDTRMCLEDLNSRILELFVRVLGYAAEKIEAWSVKKGAVLILKHEGFFVHDAEGPLREGEEERAAAWVNQIPVHHK